MIDFCDLSVLDFEASKLDVVSEYALKLAKELARQKDDLIRTCITAVIGTDWTLEQIAPRLTCERFEDSLVERWYVDGIPILEIWPLSTRNEVSEYFLSTVNVSFQYRVLYQTPRSGASATADSKT